MPTNAHLRVPLLFIISTLILAACGASGPVIHPTGAQDTVIRLSGTSGGMLPGRLYYLEDQFPAFTLFGDGRLIYTASGSFYQTHLDEAAIQRLLGVAVNDAHFFDLDDFVGPTCCDMPGTQLTITAGGKTKTLSLSILEEDKTGGTSPEGRALRVLNAINALRTGQDPGYTPAGATLYAEILRDPPTTTTPAWPLTTSTLASAAALQDGAGLHLTGAETQTALQLAPRVQSFRENDVTYSVIAVPDSP